MFQILPLAPERTRVRHDFYLLGKPNPEEEIFMDWFSHTLNVEDIDLCENVQKGLHSRGYHQGRFVVDRENLLVGGFAQRQAPAAIGQARRSQRVANGVDPSGPFWVTRTGVVLFEAIVEHQAGTASVDRMA